MSNAKSVEIIFGKNLKKLMEEHNVSYRILEEDTGIPRSSLHDYATARVAISLPTAKKLADYFNESLDWMIGDGSRRIKKITS